MKIVISGTPGTGKSTIANELGKMLGQEVLHTTDFARKYKLGKEVNIEKLRKKLLLELNRRKRYIIEGHLACEFRIPADFVFVLRTEPDMLEKRLAKRKYGRKKIEENLFAEMLDYCTQRVETEYKKPAVELDTSRLTANSAAKKLFDAIKKKRKRIDSVDYSGEMKKYLKLGKQE